VHVMHVMHVMMVMMMMVVVVVMLRRSRRGGRGGGVLRHGVAGEAERENGCGRKGLDHGEIFLWFKEPGWVAAIHRGRCLNSI
jgi:hypothetical protein